MPLVHEALEPIDFPEDIKKAIPKWIFEHTWLGYQNTRKGYFVYRLPKLRECYMYSIAVLYHPMEACRQFLGAIGLIDFKKVIGKMTPTEVGNFIVDIINESFPRDEGFYVKLLEHYKMGESVPAYILESHIKLIGSERRIWDMNIQEVFELAAISRNATGVEVKHEEETAS